ncbi:Fe-S cluster assembly protein SufD [Negadavirga shengliensis]|uniref:Fe-S cluster assembly protein SufD n=1 Tax=Negadavirga shengliensis TaxID=1389218 RepID=A0ABV9SZE2_9BACT
MTTINKEINIIDLFLEASISNNVSLADLKKHSNKVLEQKGLPAHKDEEYKYTPISKKLGTGFQRFGQASNTVKADAELLQKVIGRLGDENVVVMNNGILDTQLSRYEKSEISVTAFSELDQTVLQNRIGKISKPEDDPFTALNTSSFQDGIMIEIPNGKVLSKPLLIVHFIQANDAGQTVFPRLYIHGGKNSEAKIIEQSHFTDNEPVFVNQVSEFYVDENAHLKHYKLQNNSPAAVEVSNTGSDIHRDATFTSVLLSLEGDMIRNNLNLNILDTNCEGNMYGLYLLNGKTHVDNHTTVDHTQPHSVSNELYKGILADQSRGVFNGKIFVRQDAQKTNAFQQNNNILLSENAIVNTKPQLEIWADDVKCSHGCTTGQLDEEALFYIRARGVNKDAARALLLYAFAGEVLENIEDEAFKEHCIKLVQERLGGNY